MNARSVLALIPARGGSKSVPRKNVLPIAGRPLIAYSIDQALQSAYVTRTIVSTDDEEIAEIASHAGAEVPFLRPPQLATDTATDLDVFRHALTWLRDVEAYTPDLVVHLRPTGPVRDVRKIDDAIEAMQENPAADSLRSVGLAEQTPYKMWKIESGLLKPVLEIPGVREAHSTPRQKLPPAYWQNGYVDIVRARTVLEKASMVGDVVLPFVVNEPVVELDYPDQIPALTSAVERMLRGEIQEEASWTRHPA